MQLTDKIKNINITKAVILGLLLISLLLPIAITKLGLTFGIISLLIITGAPIAVLILSNSHFGYYLVLVLSFFINYIHRWTDQRVPLLTLEIIIFLTIIGIIIREIRVPRLDDQFWSYFKTPVAISLLIWVGYNHFQLFNPYSSEIMGKIVGIRQAWLLLLGFTLTLYLFNNLQSVKIFFKVVLIFSLIAALFGLSQKYVGLFPYEKQWLYSSPERVRLFVVWGQIRVWSFLNDPTNFGLLMASSGLICFILMTGPFKLSTKILLGISGTLMFIAMVSSGTRTAFVAVLSGFAIFGLLNIKNFKAQLITVSIVLLSLVIYFGPFYSAPVVRIRSAFQGKEDPSMNVRLVNKERIRPFMLSHPIGGGPNTTGGEITGHPLSGFPPDSGYLKIALELGYVGLILILWLYFRASSQLSSHFFQTSNPEKKVICLALLASMISLCTAEVTQITISQKPFDFFFFTYFGLIIKMKDLK